MPRSTIAESYGKFSFIRNCQTTFHGGCSLCILMSICCYHSFYCSHSDINNLRYADDTTLMAESEEELESLLMKVKEIQPVHPKEINPWCSLEGLMLKLKLKYFGHLMRRADSFEETLMLGKIEGRRRRG